MNTKQRSVLEQIFAKPTTRSLRWSAVRSLFEALDADIKEAAGSRVRVALRGRRAVFHVPHPGPMVGVKTVEDIRDLLAGAGVKP